MAVAIAWLPGPAGTRRRVAKPSVEEPDAAEPARPDLWGARVSNDPGLPDRKEAYVEPVIEEHGYRFTVKVGKPQDIEAASRGTKSGSSGSSFLCLMSRTPMSFEYVRAEGKAKRIGTRLMAIVAEGERGCVYLPPTPEMEATAHNARPGNVPDTELPPKALGFRVQEYGMKRWSDLFFPRQLVALTTFSDLVQEMVLPSSSVGEESLSPNHPDTSSRF